MFATYSVPGTDIVFACVMFALVMALAYIVGRIHKLKEINESIETFKWSRHQLCKMARETDKQLVLTEDLLRAANMRNVLYIERSMVMVEEAKKFTASTLGKKHRAAMVKYKAKCDAKVVKHMETIDAGRVVISSTNDYSALLSK